jgi:serine protease Do
MSTKSIPSTFAPSCRADLSAILSTVALAEGEAFGEGGSLKVLKYLRRFKLFKAILRQFKTLPPGGGIFSRPKSKTLIQPRFFFPTLSKAFPGKKRLFIFMSQTPNQPANSLCENLGVCRWLETAAIHFNPSTVQPRLSTLLNERALNLLVKVRRFNYGWLMSFKKHFTGLLVVCAANFALADTVQLKDADAVTGKILLEKPDSVVVDVGYTVLVVPRTSITGINKSGSVLAATPPGGSLLDITPQFYTATQAATPAHDVQDLVKQLGQAVVQVRTPEGLGSGFFVNPDGYLITNFHVIEGETEISVEVYSRDNDQLDRQTYKQVRIIAINKFHDLALLHIEDKGAPKFKYVTLGSADALNVGDSVFAIGSPLGQERTMTEGILSTKTREMEGELYLQTTAQINPGNSGGPLFNLSGEVVGVTNMKILFGEGLGFAIPVELVKNFLDHRDAFAYSSDNPNNPYRYLAPPTLTKARTPAK